MTRALSALLLALGLLFTAACSENLSGDSNPDTQVEDAPAPDEGGVEQGDGETEGTEGAEEDEEDEEDEE